MTAYYLNIQTRLHMWIETSEVLQVYMQELTFPAYFFIIFLHIRNIHPHTNSSRLLLLAFGWFSHFLRREKSPFDFCHHRLTKVGGGNEHCTVVFCFILLKGWYRNINFKILLWLRKSPKVHTRQKNKNHLSANNV